MIKYWSDQDRFYTVALIGYDTIFIHEYFRVKRTGKFSYVARDHLSPEIQQIGFSDIRINKKLLNIGFRI